MYDLIIIGGGPSGLTAAIYAARSGLNCLLIEKTFSGGQLSIIYEIENYPGVLKTNGSELGLKMDEQARAVGAKIIYEEIINVDLTNTTKKVITSLNTYETKSVIICSGTVRRLLGCENEGKFFGIGISYCAVCDGAFFKGKTVAVVGGGNTALEDAVYLSNLCEKVYLLHRRDEFRGEKHLQNLVFSNKKIEVIFNSVVVKADGENNLENIKVKNLKSNDVSTLNVSGLFVAVGSIPETSFLNGSIELTEDGYIKTDRALKTNLDGVFAAGDVIDKKVRQIVTAAADGAIAAYSVGEFLRES